MAAACHYTRMVIPDGLDLDRFRLVNWAEQTEGELDMTLLEFLHKVQEPAGRHIELNAWMGLIEQDQ